MKEYTSSRRATLRDITKDAKADDTQYDSDDDMYSRDFSNVNAVDFYIQ